MTTNNLDDCTHVAPKGQFKANHTQKNKVEGRADVKALENTSLFNPSSATLSQEIKKVEQEIIELHKMRRSEAIGLLLDKKNARFDALTLAKQIQDNERKKVLEAIDKLLFTNHNWSNRNNQWMITIGTAQELKAEINKIFEEANKKEDKK